ncbi:2-amino-4-hydroxy-6-hydroxymethyldihydropteridine diphosphokinase [Mesorhizobium sp. Z1-4]|uniref:2-amino-4-hydroxy-6- hydroxymethyldihydropteridine diphosphokinase n=1 Tax=Mesorhizobium sp. Z1-4 TaxID=2448478 RepID=UPI000FDABF42|nr:2-amino-4-hydroxy-6-hydroxymethyldihydropteridine diphosphokinase [Mesorhizobium sp. Z1-4]
MSGRNEVRAYVGLGGNIGDPRATMAAALRLLDGDADIRVARVSSLYATPPWGITDQPDFLNAAALLETKVEPRVLLERCLETEAKLHRVRDKRWGPRSVDLDVLTYGDREIDEPGLELPHPRMMDRAFVLVPLFELAPELVVRGARLESRLNEIGREGITLAAGPEWWLD